MNNSAENYLNKIKAIIPTLLSSEPDYVIFVFFQSFSQSDLGDVIKYVEYKASSLWLDITNNPTDQELIEYIKWCWEYHQKKLEMDNVLSEIKHNRPNDKCIHF